MSFPVDLEPADRAGAAPRLWEMLTFEAGIAPSRSLHCWSGDRYESSRWDRVVRDAESMTLGLRRAGLRPGDVLATVLTNGPQVPPGILAAWLAGATIASLPVPARGMDGEEYARQVERICEQLEPTSFVLEDSFLGLLPEELSARLGARSWESFAGSGRIDPAPPGDDRVAFVQYSSGSTSTPKGCMLTPRAIAAQLRLLRTMTEGEPGAEVGLSWLPLSHDMGLFGCLLYCWAFGYDFYLSSPERFTFAPRTWFGDAAEVGATMTAGTNTALYLGARAVAGGLHGDLRLRTCIIGAERIDWETLGFAADTLASHGMQREALMPAYGLAEATLAVTALPLEEAPRCVSVDAAALADGEVHEVSEDEPAATRLVSCGVPCPGVELRGVGEARLGEIAVRSGSLAEGYYGDPALTAERFADGAVLSRDLGFVRDGHLYPVGRLDDLVVVGGRNVNTSELEISVGALGGARRGCCTVVDRPQDSGSRLALLMEPREGFSDYEGLAAAAAELAMATTGVALDECLFLERGSLPKTPTGKIQRHRCRQLVEAGRLEPLATVSMGAR